MLAQVAATGNDSNLPQAERPDPLFNELPAANVVQEQHLNLGTPSLWEPSIEGLHPMQMDSYVISMLMERYVTKLMTLLDMDKLTSFPVTATHIIRFYRLCHGMC